MTKPSFHRAIAEATAAPKGRNAGTQKNLRRDAILPCVKSSGNTSRQQQGGAKSSVPSTRSLLHAELTEKYKGKPKPEVRPYIEPEKRHLELCRHWTRGNECPHRVVYTRASVGCAYAHNPKELIDGHARAGLTMKGPVWKAKLKKAQRAHRDNPQKEVQVRSPQTNRTVPLGKNAKSQLKNGNTVRPRGIVTAPVKKQVVPPPGRQPTFSAKPTPVMAGPDVDDHNSVPSSPEPFPLLCGRSSSPLMCGRSSPPVSPISQPLTSPRPLSSTSTDGSNHGPPATPSRFSGEVVRPLRRLQLVACVFVMILQLLVCLQ